MIRHVDDLEAAFKAALLQMAVLGAPKLLLAKPGRLRVSRDISHAARDVAYGVDARR